ncbi:type II secretion system protein GspG, partial [bacterium]|nr:type II secretion system protein GspG [bacterium]
TGFRIDTGNYPTTAQGLDALVTEPQGVRGWRGPYVEKLPMDPWQQPYEYRFPGTKNKSSFDLFSKGRDQTVGTDDDIGNW